MARRTMRATGRREGTQRGLTLVELLVTIVLSGLFFAAMVPVFVLASKSSSVDRTRVAALNVAQSRIEAIRSLAYESITQTGLDALESDTGAARDIRFDGPWKSDPSAKVYRVEYRVKDVTGTVATDPQQYKVVTVIVTWDGAPSVGKPVTLKTAVYRQARGPQATGLRVYTDLEPTGTQTFSTHPIKATLTVNPVDARNVDYVRFIVYANNGSQIAGGTESNYESNDGRFPRLAYDWAWLDSGEAPDGAYTFAAVAVAAGSEQTGEMWQKPIYLDDTPPDGPAWPQGGTHGIVSGANAVMLTWEPIVAGDLSHYQVERRLFNSSIDTTFVELPRWTTTLIDRRGLVPQQAYEYRVCAWDASGQQSAWSSWSSPATPRAATAPVLAAPGSLSAAQYIGTAGDLATRQRRVDLSWPASANDGAGGSVRYYLVYRSQIDPATSYVDGGDGWSSPLQVIPLTTPATQYTRSDATVDWRGTYQYRVVAADADLFASPESVSPTVQVLLPTGDFRLTVRVTADPTQIGGNAWYALASVVCLDTGEVYPQPWGITPINMKLTEAKPLQQDLTVFGRYQVVVSFYLQKKGGALFKGTNSLFVDLAELRDVTVPYQRPQ